MIKALMLIFMPARTWDGIVQAQRSISFILAVYLLPLLVLTSFCESYGLVQWGKRQNDMGYVKKFSVEEAAVYGIAQIILSIGIVFVGAKVLKSFGETFHGRHTYKQAFTVVAYGLGPLFTLRLFNVFPLNPWIAWLTGAFLCAMVLYQGIPSVMQPDPPHAFGLYLMSIFALTISTGVLRFMTIWYLQGKFKSLTPALSSSGHHLLFSFS